MSRGCALSAEWFRTAEDIMSLKERSGCVTGAVLNGARGWTGSSTMATGAGSCEWVLAWSRMDFVRPKRAKGLGLGFLVDDALGLVSQSAEDTSDRSDLDSRTGADF